MSYSVDSVLKDENLISSFPWNRDSLIAFGNHLSNYGREKSLPLAVAVCLEDVKIFQTFLDGTSDVNEIWVQRKINTVNAISHSTLYLRAVLDKGAYAELALNNHIGELAACGGGVPVLKEGKIYAIIIVSGLPHEEDHAVIMNSFKDFEGGYGK